MALHGRGQTYSSFPLTTSLEEDMPATMIVHFLLVSQCFELTVYVASSSLWIMRIMLAVKVVYLFTLAGFFFSGKLSVFTTSWLGFVITLSFSAFLYMARRAAMAIRTV